MALATEKEIALKHSQDVHGLRKNRKQTAKHNIHQEVSKKLEGATDSRLEQWQTEFRQGAWEEIAQDDPGWPARKKLLDLAVKCRTESYFRDCTQWLAGLATDHQFLPSSRLSLLPSSRLSTYPSSTERQQQHAIWKQEASRIVYGLQYALDTLNIDTEAGLLQEVIRLLRSLDPELLVIEQNALFASVQQEILAEERVSLKRLTVPELTAQRDTWIETLQKQLRSAERAQSLETESPAAKIQRLQQTVKNLSAELRSLAAEASTAE